MKGRLEACRDEVVASNREAAAQVRLEDVDVMYVLEAAIGGERRRVYELDLRQAIAKLAEDLVRVEAELQARMAPPRRRNSVLRRARRAKVQVC